MNDKKFLSERDIISKFILPSIKKAGWDEKQIREEVSFTDGRIFVKGQRTVRGERKRADIILYCKQNIPLAVIEAKDNNHPLGCGTQQALWKAAPSDWNEKSEKYIVRITGDEKEAKQELDNFQNPEEKFPVIATTSKLLTTGTDIKTCKLIVIDANIESPIEFKQIIGRGTRICEEYGKDFFTIMDFRNATAKFADPAFDGEAVRIKKSYPKMILQRTIFWAMMAKFCLMNLKAS